jgi:hypothetical protein
VARNLVRDGDQVKRRRSESWRVQRLTDVASRLGSLGMMVQKGDARHDVQKHQAAKNSKRLVRKCSREEPGW